MLSSEFFPETMNFFFGLELCIFLFSPYFVLLFFQSSYIDAKVNSTWIKVTPERQVVCVSTPVILVQ